MSLDRSPYFMRAIYEWIVDNGWTPYLLVNALIPDVRVPEVFVQDDKITLNVQPIAVGHFRMGHDAIEFDARFSGVAYHVYLPIRSIQAVYAYENNEGIFFGVEDAGDRSDKLGLDGKHVEKKGQPSNVASLQKTKINKKAHLKIIK